MAAAAAEPAPAKPELTYAMRDYWDTRYSETTCEPYDWYVKWQHLKEALKPLNLAAHSQILIAGCGTSMVCQELLDEGLPNITNFDWCKLLVEQMAEQYQEKASVRFVALDAEHLPEEMEEQYDLILDKGLLDATVSAPGGAKKAQRILDRFSKCLRLTNASYVCVSHAPPRFRLPHLLGPQRRAASGNNSEEYGWKVNVHTIPRPEDGLERTKAFDADDNVYYVYICEKFRM